VRKQAYIIERIDDPRTNQFISLRIFPSRRLTRRCLDDFAVDAGSFNPGYCCQRAFAWIQIAGGRQDRHTNDYKDGGFLVTPAR